MFRLRPSFQLFVEAPPVACLLYTRSRLGLKTCFLKLRAKEVVVEEFAQIRGACMGGCRYMVGMGTLFPCKG